MLKKRFETLAGCWKKICTYLSKPDSRYLQTHDYTVPQPDVGMDKMEKNLREKISLNLPNIMRAFHLFDYNRDEHIQKHEMRKVLENYCFRMTDNQFER